MNQLEVYPSMTLQQLEQHFSRQYPYLRLELTLPNRSDQPPHQSLDVLSGQPSHSCFLITPDMSADELVQTFLECMHLPIRLIRRAGYTWHDTDMEGQWTLQQHNHKGALLSGTATQLNQHH